MPESGRPIEEPVADAPQETAVPRPGRPIERAVAEADAVGDLSR